MPTRCVGTLAMGVGVSGSGGGRGRESGGGIEWEPGWESEAPWFCVVTDPVACMGLVPTTTADFEPWVNFPGAAVCRFLVVARDCELSEAGLEGGLAVGIRDIVVDDKVGFAGEVARDCVLADGRFGSVEVLGEGLGSRERGCSTESSFQK